MTSNSADRLVNDIIAEMGPVSKVIDQLHSDGYHYTFELKYGGLLCNQNHQFYYFNEYWADEIYRIEDVSKALGIIYFYAIRNKMADVKGLLITEQVLEAKFGWSSAD